VKPAPCSQSKNGIRANNDPSCGDLCKRAPRPNATSTVAIRNVRLTSIPAVPERPSGGQESALLKHRQSGQALDLNHQQAIGF
jgi:hypothetical protein